MPLKTPQLLKVTTTIILGFILWGCKPNNTAYEQALTKADSILSIKYKKSDTSFYENGKIEEITLKDSVISAAIIKVEGIHIFYANTIKIRYYQSGKLRELLFEKSSITYLVDTITSEELIKEVNAIDTINSVGFDSTGKQLNWTEFQNIKE